MKEIVNVYENVAHTGYFNKPKLTLHLYGKPNTIIAI